MSISVNVAPRWPNLLRGHHLEARRAAPRCGLGRASRRSRPPRRCRGRGGGAPRRAWRRSCRRRARRRGRRSAARAGACLSMARVSRSACQRSSRTAMLSISTFTARLAEHAQVPGPWCSRRPGGVRRLRRGRWPRRPAAPAARRTPPRCPGPARSPRRSPRPAGPSETGTPSRSAISALRSLMAAIRSGLLRAVVGAVRRQRVVAVAGRRGPRLEQSGVVDQLARAAPTRPPRPASVVCAPVAVTSEPLACHGAATAATPQTTQRVGEAEHQGRGDQQPQAGQALAEQCVEVLHHVVLRLRGSGR